MQSRLMHLAIRACPEETHSTAAHRKPKAGILIAALICVDTGHCDSSFPHAVDYSTLKKILLFTYHVDRIFEKSSRIRDSAFYPAVE